MASRKSTRSTRGRKTQTVPEPKGIPSVAYYRMSSDKQETSIPDQRTAVEKFAEANGYRIDWEYADEGISGDATEKRVGFQRMIADAADGEFEAILCWDMDRFGRFDSLEAGYWIKPLRDKGVRLVTIGQGSIDWNDFAGRIMYGIQQEGKNQYLSDLSRNVLRGRIASAKKGNVAFAGQSPFGYRLENKRRVSDENADIVREIFRRYLAGESIRDIGKAIQVAGHRTATGLELWPPQTIHDILSNPVYTGTIVVGRRRRGKYYRTTATGEIAAAPPGKSAGWVAADDCLRVPEAHEAIVSQADFDRVQAALQARRQQSSSARGKRAFAMSGLLFCSECGGRMVARAASNEYSCRRYNEYGRDACNRNPVDCDEILRLAVGRVLAYLRGDEVRRDLNASIDVEASAAKRPTGEVDKLRKRLATLDKKINTAAKRFLQASEDIAGLLMPKLEQMQADRDQMRQRIAAAEKNVPSADHDPLELAEHAKQVLDTLADRLDQIPPDKLNSLLREVIDRVDYFFDHPETGRRRDRFRRAVVHANPQFVTHLSGTTK